MTFKAGDRIRANEGVCPGHYGFVIGIKNVSNDTYNVIYDSGRKDSIFGRMLELVYPGEDFDVDE